MSMPESWVERIFSRLAVRYGTDWTMKWTGLDPAAVKADWAACLAHVRPEAISYALGYLPHERPPTATQFREICNRAPEAAPPLELPAPKADRALVDSIMARIPRLRDQNPRAWAERLRDREENHGGALPNGRPMTITQRVMWREALDAPALGSMSSSAGFMGIDPSALPPAMRPVEPEPEWVR